MFTHWSGAGINTWSYFSVAAPFTLPVHDTLALLQIQIITNRLNFTHTNYGFCKNLTEQMLGGYHNKPFPVCINRPVAVGCVAKEPCPGYVGNTSGATGTILSMACGEHMLRVGLRVDSSPKF